MAHSIKLELPDALILVGLWSLPAEGAARWVKLKTLPEARFTPISMKRYKGLLPALVQSTIELTGQS